MSINSVKLDILADSSYKERELFYKGNLALLEKRRIAIVGSRKPNGYAKEKTHILASALAQAGVCIVSGGAIGIDAIAHKAAQPHNTIMVAATGLNKRYPAINKNLIQSIEEEGLVLSQFEATMPSHRYNFVLRNELIVALSEALIVTYADKNSGSMRSVEYALKMQKPVYVLPHRLGESEATQELLAQNKAEAIYDIEAFVSRFGTSITQKTDPFLEFCKKHPSYEEVVLAYGDKVFEYELLGKIIVKNSKVFVV
jgi:DNA processing protein